MINVILFTSCLFKWISLCAFAVRKEQTEWYKPINCSFYALAHPRVKLGFLLQQQTAAIVANNVIVSIFGISQQWISNTHNQNIYSLRSRCLVQPISSQLLDAQSWSKRKWNNRKIVITAISVQTNTTKSMYFSLTATPSVYREIFKWNFFYCSKSH